MSAFVLKIIALTTMILDHMGAVFPQHFGFEFRVIGRVAFPIYVFLVAEGFRYTKSPVKFLARLFVFAIISEPFFDGAIRGASSLSEVNFFANTNIFYTLFLGGAAIVAYQWIRKIYPQSIGFAVAAIAPLFAFMWLAETALTTDYGAYGVAFIFIMYVIGCGKLFSTDYKIESVEKESTEYKTLHLMAMAVLCIWQHRVMIRFAMQHGISAVPTIRWMLIPATLVAVVLVAFYNGKRGPSLKWFFYASYPVHLAILAFL